MIDHTILKATTTKEDVVKICKEAKEYGFFSVCINPANIELAKEELKGSDVKVCTVIGFPLGATTTTAKIGETRHAIENGAQEVDMVVNIGAIKDTNWELVQSDIEGVVNASKDKALVKVIIETCLLTEEEIAFYEREAVRYYSNIMGAFSLPAKKATEKCDKSGIGLKILTGDNIVTATSIAKQLNIVKEDSIIIEAQEIDHMSNEELLKIYGEI